MKWLGLVMAGFAMIGTAQASPTRLVSEDEFAGLLLGCWSAGEWGAELVGGGYSGGLDVVCFDKMGRVLTEAGSYDRASGRFWFVDGKLHIEADVISTEWAFHAAVMKCDARAKPGEGLFLINCSGRQVGTNGILGPVERLESIALSTLPEGKE